MGSWSQAGSTGLEFSAALDFLLDGLLRALGDTFDRPEQNQDGRDQLGDDDQAAETEKGPDDDAAVVFAPGGESGGCKAQ